MQHGADARTFLERSDHRRLLFRAQDVCHLRISYGTYCTPIIRACQHIFLWYIKYMSEDQVQPPNKDAKPAKDSSEAPNSSPITPVPDGEIKPPEYPAGTQTDKAKRKRKPLSCFELCTVILGGIGILVAATGVAIVWQDVIANRSLVEVKKQYPELQKSADAAYAEVRPWIRISLALGTSGLVKNPDRQIINVVPTISNIGQSTATDITVRVEDRIPNMNVPGSSPDSIFGVVENLKTWCNAIKPDIGGLVTDFPKEPRTLPNWSVNILNQDIQKNAFVEPNGVQGYSIFLYGCTLYRSGSDTPWHHSGIVYELGRRDSRGVFAMLHLGESYGVN